MKRCKGWAVSAAFLRFAGRRVKIGGKARRHVQALRSIVF
jgi:hypothetical protein